MLRACGTEIRTSGGPISQLPPMSPPKIEALGLFHPPSSSTCQLSHKGSEQCMVCVQVGILVVPTICLYEQWFRRSKVLSCSHIDSSPIILLAGVHKIF